MPYSVVDLFCGVGGLSLSAARADFDIALAVEFDKHAVAAHQKNFPGVKHLQSDISQLSGLTLLQQAGLAANELDGLVGGPPCQGFSAIGRRNIDDERNSLFVKFFELVSECRPRFFVVENVPGILEDKYDDVRARAFEHIPADYTLLNPMKLRASDFGAPTTRERVFFVGYRSDDMEALTPTDFSAPNTIAPVLVEEALCGLPLEICHEWQTEELSWRKLEQLPNSLFGRQVAGHIPDGVGDARAIQRYRDEQYVSGCFGTRHSVEVQARYEGLRPGERDAISKSQRLKLDGFCPTLRAGTGPDKGSYQAVRPIHPTVGRVITPREAARLQGFPDWYQFAPSKWHSFRQIGNSVSPIVGEAVFRVIAAHLE